MGVYSRWTSTAIGMTYVRDCANPTVASNIKDSKSAGMRWWMDGSPPAYFQEPWFGEGRRRQCDKPYPTEWNRDDYCWRLTDGASINKCGGIHNTKPKGLGPPLVMIGPRKAPSLPRQARQYGPEALHTSQVTSLLGLTLVNELPGSFRGEGFASAFET